MAKKIKALIKVQVVGGKANPAPPLGPALGQHGMNIAEFCQKVNAATQDRLGEVVPVIISLFDDRSYTFILKTAPVAEMIKKAAKIEKGSAKPHTDKVGKITKAQVRDIAERKLADLNCSTIEAAMSQVEGTAKNMGVELVG